MEFELHLTKKDFKIEWYSGTGAGGQHRNKHQNCCRITHIKSGLQENGTESKSRVSNQKKAFEKLAYKVVKWYRNKQSFKNFINDEVIRNYNEPRNEVHDKISNFKQPYIDVIVKGDISKMIESRRNNIIKGKNYDSNW
jgi:protein subunit release factor A